MRIIEIAALSNGAHRNQTGEFRTIPNGWAVVPADMETENFPFGEVTVEERNGVPTVTGWTPLPMPEVEPVKPVEGEATADELLKILAGVSE